MWFYIIYDLYDFTRFYTIWNQQYFKNDSKIFTLKKLFNYQLKYNLSIYLNAYRFESFFQWIINRGRDETLESRSTVGTLDRTPSRLSKSLIVCKINSILFGKTNFFQKFWRILNS
jgi:hypothetical protein